jgi:hypothetical protein
MTSIYLFCMIFLNLALAQYKSLDKPDPWCIDKSASLKRKQLECLRSTVETQTLRKILSAVASGERKAPPLNLNGQISKQKFLKLFSRPILVFQISFSETAGYDVYFVFKNFPNHEFFAWFAPDDNDEFTLDMLVDSGPEKESAQTRMKLRKKEFRRYWL